MQMRLIYGLIQKNNTKYDCMAEEMILWIYQNLQQNNYGIYIIKLGGKC